MEIKWYSTPSWIQSECSDVFNDFLNEVERLASKRPDIEYTRISDNEFNRFKKNVLSSNGSSEGLCFVFCEPESELARWAREQKRMAQWGFSSLGKYALVWERDNPYIVFHEMLHLFGLDDCYEPDTGKPNCENEHCVMYWKPTEQHCDGQLSLCAQRLDLLKVMVPFDSERES